MKIVRAIVSGIIIWVSIFIVFTIMSFIPVIKDSEIQQNMLLWVVLIPIVLFGVSFYYKKEMYTNGLLLGLVVVTVSLILDALITVPLVIIPHGGSYNSFFASPLLLVTVVEILLISFLFWKTKISKIIQIES
jgi:hypothetical protein